MSNIQGVSSLIMGMPELVADHNQISTLSTSPMQTNHNQFVSGKPQTAQFDTIIEPVAITS
jgi:hypothetical protein